MKDFEVALPEDIFEQIKTLKFRIRNRLLYIVKFLAKEMMGLNNKQINKVLPDIQEWVCSDEFDYEDIILDTSITIESLTTPFFNEFFYNDDENYSFLMKTSTDYFDIECPLNWLYEDFEDKVIKERDLFRQTHYKNEQEKSKIIDAAKAKLTDKEKELLGIK